jgi:hypothetical protein
LALSAVLGVVLAMSWDAALMANQKLSVWVSSRIVSVAHPMVIVSAQIIGVTMLATLFNGAPDFVYRAY